MSKTSLDRYTVTTYDTVGDLRRAIGDIPSEARIVDIEVIEEGIAFTTRTVTRTILITAEQTKEDG